MMTKTGNLRNLPLILIPAICNEPKSPFGDYSICMADGAAYVSVSMAVLLQSSPHSSSSFLVLSNFTCCIHHLSYLQVAGIYTWSYVYVIMKISAEKSNVGEREAHHSVVSIRSSSAASEITEPLLISKVRTCYDPTLASQFILVFNQSARCLVHLLCTRNRMYVIYSVYIIHLLLHLVNVTCFVHVYTLSNHSRNSAIFFPFY